LCRARPCNPATISFSLFDSIFDTSAPDPRRISGRSASLVFEQSYGGVDGDSASAAELFALLSALADAPIKQCSAVTGLVDQRLTERPRVSAGEGEDFGKAWDSLGGKR
jgi:hypothetical protein